MPQSFVNPSLVIARQVNGSVRAVERIQEVVPHEKVSQDIFGSFMLKLTRGGQVPTTQEYRDRLDAIIALGLEHDFLSSLHGILNIKVTPTIFRTSGTQCKVKLTAEGAGLCQFRKELVGISVAINNSNSPNGNPFPEFRNRQLTVAQKDDIKVAYTPTLEAAQEVVSILEEEFNGHIIASPARTLDFNPLS